MDKQTNEQEHPIMTFEECFTKCDKLIDALQKAQVETLAIAVRVDTLSTKQKAIYNINYSEVSSIFNDAGKLKFSNDSKRAIETEQQLSGNQAYINISADLGVAEITVKDLNNAKILIEHKLSLYKRLLDNYNNQPTKLVESINNVAMEIRSSHAL